MPVPVYDLFLAGPWEQFVLASSPGFEYKTRLKRAFPNFNFYDPEDHQDVNWHVSNSVAISRSRGMFVLVPEFPFPGCGIEAGMFFRDHAAIDRKDPLRELVFLWPPEIKPAWGKDVAARYGCVFTDLDSAIAHMMKVL